MPKALLLENIHPDAAKSLRDHGFEVETMKGALSEDELIDALDGVDLVGVRSKTNVTARVLDARPTLLQHPFRGGIGDLRHHLLDAPHSRTHASHQAWPVGQVRFRLA